MSIATLSSLLLAGAALPAAEQAAVDAAVKQKLRDTILKDEGAEDEAR